MQFQIEKNLGSIEMLEKNPRGEEKKSQCNS